MKVEGDKKAIRKLDKLKGKVREKVSRTIVRSTEEGARVTRVLAPNVSGETVDAITTEYRNGGMVGEVVVIDSSATRAEKDRAYSIEHGRKSGDRGTTEGFHHVRTARQYLGKRLKRRISRAVSRAAKEVAQGG